jgi:RyR domain/SLOG in TRPM, prokaryote
LSTALSHRRARNDIARGEIREFARTKLKEYWTEARQRAPSPWTFYRMSLAYLYLNKPYPAFAACAKALQLSRSELVLDAAYDALSALDECEEGLTGCEWLRRLLLIGAAGKFQSRSALSQILVLASNAPSIKAPVTIFAGGCRADDNGCLMFYRPLVLQAFSTYTGTIISGGTASGVCSLAGDVQEACPESIHAIGYVPRDMTEVPIDDRYREIRHTPGAEFSALEVIQYWCDLIASGVPPAHVKVFGIDGGSISASEYKMALALGASVALLQGSGREAKKIRHNRQWRDSRGLVCIPVDPYVIEEFAKPHPVQLDPPNRERLARVIHEEYRDNEKDLIAADDPAVASWEELPSYLRHSNRAQADRVCEKIQRIGYAIEKSGTKTPVTEFTAEELDIMAQMEHGRWVIERLDAGWQPGPRRDVRQKISPYFVSWTALSEDLKNKERQIVRDIPKLLATIDLYIYKARED